TEFNEFAALVPAAGTATISRNPGGWTVGAGIRNPLRVFGFFGPHWTAKTEYLYLDPGRSTHTLPLLRGPPTLTTPTPEHTFRGGINYHFNAPAPAVVAAKY